MVILTLPLVDHMPCCVLVKYAENLLEITNWVEHVSPSGSIKILLGDKRLVCDNVGVGGLGFFPLLHQWVSLLAREKPGLLYSIQGQKSC